MTGADEKGAPFVTINYIKSGAFREATCDGVIGGPTPNGNLWIAFFTERFPLPRMVRHKLKPSGSEGAFTLDEESPPELIESREGVVRNVEFGVYMDVESAEKLYAWLGKSLEEMKHRETSQ